MLTKQKKPSNPSKSTKTKLIDSVLNNEKSQTGLRILKTDFVSVWFLILLSPTPTKIESNQCSKNYIYMFDIY